MTERLDIRDRTAGVDAPLQRLTLEKHADSADRHDARRARRSKRLHEIADTSEPPHADLPAGVAAAVEEQLAGLELEEDRHDIDAAIEDVFSGG